MAHKNDGDIAKILAILGASYPKFTLTSNTIHAYCELLRDLPLDILKAAALHCASTRDFFPSVHELRQAAGEIYRQSLGIPNAYAAWENLLGANGQLKVTVKIEENIVDGKNEFTIYKQDYDFLPFVRQVGEMLGWPRFPNPETEMADRAHFIKAYEQTVSEYLSQRLQLPAVAQVIQEKRKELPDGRIHTNPESTTGQAHVDDTISGLARKLGSPRG